MIDMSERVDCQWMKKYKSPGFHKDEPCNICKGYVVVNDRGTCPFESITYTLIPELQHLVTADERLYSLIQAHEGKRG